MENSKKYDEKGANLASKIPPDLANKFRIQAKERRQFIKYNLAAAVRLWVSLPEDLQAKLLNQKISGNELIDLINDIIDQRLANIFEASEIVASAEARSKVQKEKKSRKSLKSG